MAEEPTATTTTKTETTTEITGETPLDPQNDAGSLIFGVSIRAWVALIFAATVCGVTCANATAQIWIATHKQDFGALTNFTFGEPFYSLSIMSLSFYFGHKVGQQQLKGKL